MNEKRDPEHTEEMKRIFMTLGKVEMRSVAKEAFKEASKEFLESIYQRFGKWSLYAIGAGLITFLMTAAIYAAAWLNGWRPH